MARYTYTVTSCPHCRQELSNDSWKIFPWIMACIGTMFTIFFWLIGIAIINKIFDYDGVSIGDPYYKCPHCKKLIRDNNKFEWGDLKSSYKKQWTFRYLIRVCYAMSGLFLTGIIFPLLVGMWWSKVEVDRASAKVFLIVAIVSLIVILYLYYRWKKYRDSKEFVIAERDVQIIKDSWTRTRKENPSFNSNDKIRIWNTDRIIVLKKVKVEDDDNDDELDNDLEEDSNLTIKEQEELKEKLELAKKSMEKGIITYSQYSKIKDEIEESLGISNDEDEELDDEDCNDDDEDCGDGIDSEETEDFEEDEELDGEDNDEELDDEDGIEEDDDYDFEEISRKIDNKNKKHIIVVKKSNKE